MKSKLGFTTLCFNLPFEEKMVYIHSIIFFRIQVWFHILDLTSQTVQHRCSATAAPTTTSTPPTTAAAATTPHQRRKSMRASHVTNQSVTSFTDVTLQTWGNEDECSQLTTLFRVWNVTYRHFLTRKSLAKLIPFGSPLGKSGFPNIFLARRTLS